ncbi:MAG: VOC family protein [Hyphomonadaceae bacterium]|nr:VOC family protein [Hyphomonadaceae bacterium]
MGARFEIHVNDVAAAKRFYAGLFGWTFTAMPGGEAVDYQFIHGPAFTGDLGGGMMRRMDAGPVPGSSIRGAIMSFEVDDCDQSYAWALANGGSEALPPADYPDIGRCAYVEDGQGNVVGMITPSAENS